jgi:DNA mismatch repair ATPase MutS
LRDAGLHFSWPEVSVTRTDSCRIEGCYNVVLALKLAAQGHEPELSRLIVANDLAFGPHEIAVLTGPNQGGKTTYMRAVGLAHVMCQAGLPVPGLRARLAVVDAVHTHFPRSERGDLESGRFAEEMRRLREIFAQATPQSLILLNESLAATNSRESLELAREVVGALQALGARAIYTTHLFELASEAAAFNRDAVGPGCVVSLVARPDLNYRIERGPAAGSSHAREVAARCGISFAQLIELLRSRGIVP